MTARTPRMSDVITARFARRFRAAVKPVRSASKRRAKVVLRFLSRLRFVPVFAAPLALSACGGDEVYEWRQKMTVEVETPWGVRTGSSVQYVKLLVGKGPTEYYGWGVGWRTDGEAVVVDVRPDAPAGQPRYLFALLIGDKVNQWRGGSWGAMGANGLEALVGTQRFVGKIKSSYPLYGAMAQVMVDLPSGASGEAKERSLPAMATFADVADARSVRVVDPMALDEAFGPGVRLKRVTITKTDEPVTDGRVIALLSWLMDTSLYHAADAPATVGDQTLVQQLRNYHFVDLSRWGRER